ncbi:hypothetical protein COE92_18330 [Bacillus wiedmannii]|uniref:hypothetical protein n=1 Tax=Bacillus wiedmannii TaxID=1890302 RepID=UPI000BFB360E|nr:hypothetical protein [Bacillus wiedmannii]PHB52890.1 hypothetical protein COE92_18330 [Bacillus wiedmannii]
MAVVGKSVKKTGYADIDKILMDAHKLIQEGNQLQQDIEVAVKFKPKNPFKPNVRTSRMNRVLKNLKW